MTPTAPPRTTTARAGGGVLTGTGTLVRFLLRRDRVRIPVWIGALTLSLVATAASFPELYQRASDRQARAQLMANPSATAIGGPGYGLDDYTFGAMLANEMLGMMAVLTALMSVLLLVRHTRAEEASGRAELLRSGVVGRHAATAAAVTVVAGTNVVLALAIAVGLGGLGIESIDWSGSFLYGAALGSVGLVFAGVAAVTAQVTEHSRGSSGLAGAAIGLAFLLRAAGDLGNGALSWLSPIGWAQQTRVYVDDRWWPLGLAVAAFVVLAAVAVVVTNRRDVGAGLRRPRPGRPVASAGLATPAGLALRLQRSALGWWAVALLVFGLVYGSLVGEVQGFVEELEGLEGIVPEVAGAAFVDAFLALVISLLAMVCGVYVILAVLRLRGEESDGRAEPVLATAVSRPRWVASHLLVAAVGGPVVLLVSALGLGISASSVLGDAEMVPRLLGAALAHVPVLWFVAGVTVALFGLLPRAAPAAWAVVVYALVVGMFGALLGFPDWMYNLSPYEHIPAVPAEDLAAAPLLALTGLAAALVAVGLAGFRRRDLEAV